MQKGRLKYFQTAFYSQAGFGNPTFSMLLKLCPVSLQAADVFRHFRAGGNLV